MRILSKFFMVLLRLLSFRPSQTHTCK